MTVIETQRLVLRPWDEADAPALFPLAGDPAVGPAAGWPAHASEEESLRVIRDVLSMPGSFAVCLRVAGPAGEPAGTLVGAVALKDADASSYVAGADERELGYWIGRPFWGRGYAPEAARALMDHARRALGIRTVWLGYYVGNRKSARAQDKLGFRYVHTERGVAVPLLGEVRDEVVNRLDLADGPADVCGEDGAGSAVAAAHAGDGAASCIATEDSLVARALAVLADQPDPARFLSITEPLRLGRVAVRAVGEDLGVLVRFKRNGAYFAAPVDDVAARIMAGLVPDRALVSLPDDRYLPIFTDGADEAETGPGRYELWVLDGDTADGSPAPLATAGPPAGTPPSACRHLAIHPLDEGHLEAVAACYHLIPREDIVDHLRRGWIWGGFDEEGGLVGFIGEHDEASMGMLEVFPEHRRRGYAQALEAALIERFRAVGRTPYCHVALGNEASRALQRKLGLRQQDTIQCWFEMPERG